MGDRHTDKQTDILLIEIILGIQVKGLSVSFFLFLDVYTRDCNFWTIFQRLWWVNCCVCLIDDINVLSEKLEVVDLFVQSYVSVYLWLDKNGVWIYGFKRVEMML